MRNQPIDLQTWRILRQRAGALVLSAGFLRRRAGALALSTGLLFSMLVGGCASLRQVAALHQVEFALDRVAEVDLAGVRIDGVRSYQDLSVTDAARIAAAVIARHVPFSFVAHVGAQNPATNSVTARLLELSWTAYIENRATVSGALGGEYLLPPGDMVDIPLRVQMDLWDFFSGQAGDLFRLARAVAGVGEPTSVSLKAQPRIQTPIGPIQYPTEITIVSRRVTPVTK